MPSPRAILQREIFKRQLLCELAIKMKHSLLIEDLTLMSWWIDEDRYQLVLQSLREFEKEHNL